mgnify:CR=1 FL=1
MEVVWQSTPAEWQAFGEVLRRGDQAKQWVIGDWLVDGKSHYGDALCKEAARVLELEESTFRKLKSLLGAV